MKRAQLFFLFAMTLVAARTTHAACSNGFTLYMAGQLPDFTFTAGEPATIRFNPWYVSFTSADYSCGVFARSTTPGVSIQQSYACSETPCPIAPPGHWTAVADAYGASDTSVVHKVNDIPIIFDGTAPAGTYGTIEIGVRDNDIGIESHRIIGTANVWVAAAGVSPPATWFTVRTLASNISADRVILDHPYLNGQTSTNVFITHVRNPGGTLNPTSWNHPIAVLYDAVLQRWVIRNTDGTVMPTGLAFGVRIDPTGFIHCTSSAGSQADVNVNNSQGNNNSRALVLVTPINGGAHPIAVKYQSPSWKIFYSDGAAIPASTCFNVKVFAFTQYLNDPASGDLSGLGNVGVNWGVGADVGGSGTGHTSGSSRVLQFNWSQNGSSRPVMVTHNTNPFGTGTIVGTLYLGVTAPQFFGGRWSITNENGAAMSTFLRFNVWQQCAGSAWYPDADGDGWGGAGVAQASCASLPGYASKPGDCNDGTYTVHPQAPELNDGLDNQCPGEIGYGQVDEISGATLFTDDTTFCWGAQSGTALYRVARSGKASFSPCTHLPTTTGTCLTDSATPSPGQTFFYLVRAENPGPGSWGADSAGQERLIACQ